MSRTPFLAKPQGRALLALLVASLFGLAWPTSASAVEWGSEQDMVRSEVLGTFWGNPLTLELRTQMASLESSHVRVTLGWFNKIQKVDESQVIIEDERAARFEQYSVTYDRPNMTVIIAHPCPINRKDKETTCEERWIYHQGKNKFVLKEKTSSNPVSRERDSITTLIKQGKMDRALASIELMKKEASDPKSISTDEWFVAYFDVMHAQIRAAWKAKQLDKATKLLDELHAKSPLASSLSCPDAAERFVFCLDGKTECGCSERFGLLPADERYAKKLEELALVWAKNKAHRKVVAALTPVAQRFPDETAARLLLADALWELDFKEKARPHYQAVRRIRLVDRTFIPPHVFERFKEP